MMRQVLYFLSFSLFLPCIGQDSIWIEIDEGLFYNEFNSKFESPVGDGRITFIKIDLNKYALKLLTASELKEKGMTVKRWVTKYNLIGAINAGMFQTDYSSNVGFMKNGNHINNKKRHPKYFSFSFFNPLDKSDPYFQMVDSDEIVSLDYSESASHQATRTKPLVETK